MAAGKRHRLKINYAARVRGDSEYASEEGRNLKELMIMASAPPDEISLSYSHSHSPLRSAPEHINGSTFSFPNPSSLPSQNMLPHPSGSITASISSQRRRKMSKHSINTLKRSVSTPNVREAGMSVADKRRNKLGYHRTSVACGHCRRRKIRCLLAPDDAHNRCSNCIRLKKECNFFPVDQQPQIERRPRTVSKIEHAGETSASSSSSPAMAGGNHADPIDHFNHYPPIPLSNQDYPPLTAAMNGDLLSPVGRGPLSHRVYEYPHPHERAHWDSPFFDHPPLSAGHSTPEDPAQAYWKLAESPVTPGFSSHFSQPPSSVPQQARDPGPSYTSLPPSREEGHWSMHPRSLSFGHVDDASLSYHNSHYNSHSPLPLEFRRRASDMHPPSLQTSTTSSNTSVSEARSTPLSAPPMASQPMHSYGGSPTWSAITSHSLLGKGPEYGGWYSDPPSLTKVQEEEAGHHFGPETPVIYASNENP